MSRKMLAWSMRFQMTLAASDQVPRVVDALHSEQGQRAEHEHGGAGADEDVVGEHEQHQEREERQRRGGGMQPAAELGLDLLDGVADGLGRPPRQRLGSRFGSCDEISAMNVSDLRYGAYERRLLRRLDTRLPRHVGAIIDGNRRWAKDARQDLESGYQAGAAKVDEFLAWCHELGVGTVTFWVLSTDNLQRSADELTSILDAVEALVDGSRPTAGGGRR